MPPREPDVPPVDTPAGPPDPLPAGTLDELVERLRSLKVWAGDPSYETITGRINEARSAAGRPAGELARKSTVADCFRTGRQRVNAELVVAVVQALHADAGYLTRWRQALRVIGGQSRAALQVRVQDKLPQDLAGFTGRGTELDRLRQAVRHGRSGGAVVISAIEGMAGVGKTQLAVHAAHILAGETPFEHVLFVNLRGFHPDPAQPPADPAAVLDGFLRVLGVPGHEVPHDLDARVAAYRDRLAGTRALVVLDNAASAEQVRPLLPTAARCATLVTSRRGLTELAPATHLTLDVFTPDEAVAFLGEAVPDVPVGPDPDAPGRIARRCGHLPLALGLVAGHIRRTPGWTLTDHADRLDERHGAQRLDTGVELALHLSYQHLPADHQRFLRLLSLHPGPDFDAHAAAALTVADLPAARAHLDELCRNHLLQHATTGRYTFHDLVRAFATGRAGDEDSPRDRRAALTRLFDFYLATAADAMHILYPADTHRPDIDPCGTPLPDVTTPDTARTWLDTERHTLVAVAVHTATEGWPAHATRLARTLYNYLVGGYHNDAILVHGHANQAARQTGDVIGQAYALNHLGAAHMQLGQLGPAAEQFERALVLFRQGADPLGQARALHSLGLIEDRLGHSERAGGHHEQALARYRQAGDRVGEGRSLINLGRIEHRLGRFPSASDHFAQARHVLREIGDRDGEANALIGLGEVELGLGRFGPAADHLGQAVELYRRLGRRNGEAWALDSLGGLHIRLGQHEQAAEHYRRALDTFREIGEREGEACALIGLGEAAHAAGRPADALARHTAAHTIATDIASREQQARSHAGLGRARAALGDTAEARRHYQQALALFIDLGMPDAEQVRAHLATLDATG